MSQNSPYKKLIVVFFIAVSGITLLIAPESKSQLPSKLKASEQAQREQMLKMSRQLGVTCDACHNPNNFAATDKANFAIAKEHLRITQTLIDAGFDGQNHHPMADCFMCHRGKLKPDHQEKFDPMTMKHELDSKVEGTKPSKGEEE